MNKKHIEPPLTPEQLKEKIKNSTIVFPKEELEGGFGDTEPEDVISGKAQPSHVEITGVGYRQDEVGVDLEGKEHKFPGGMWVVVNWTVPGLGFGEITLRHGNDGILHLNTEGLGKEFAKAILGALVNKGVEKERNFKRRRLQ